MTENILRMTSGSPILRVTKVKMNHGLLPTMNRGRGVMPDLERDSSEGIFVELPLRNATFSLAQHSVIDIG